MDFDSKASGWDTPDKVLRSRTIAQHIQERVDLSGRPSSLEVGAGTGLLSRALFEYLGPVTLVDQSPRMLDVAAEALRSEGSEGWAVTVRDIESEPLPAGPYELIISQMAFHHILDIPGVLTKLWHALLPGGFIAIADLDLDENHSFHAGVEDFSGHHGFEQAQFQRWMRQAGFVDAKVETITYVKRDDLPGSLEHPIFLATGRRR